MVDSIRKLLRKVKNWEWGDQQTCTFNLPKESQEDMKTRLKKLE